MIHSSIMNTGSEAHSSIRGQKYIMKEGSSPQ